jgi:hypothetical protein
MKVWRKEQHKMIKVSKNTIVGTETELCGTYLKRWCIISEIQRVYA